jgi:hypothetical protein
MTETPTTYPPDTVRIVASYPGAQVGDVFLPGHPDSVDIVLNGDAVPANPAERTVFLTALLDALFRSEARDPEAKAPDGGCEIVTTSTGVDESRLADRVRAYGRVR